MQASVQVPGLIPHAEKEEEVLKRGAQMDASNSVIVTINEENSGLFGYVPRPFCI